MARFKKIPQKKRESKIVYGDGIVDGIVLLAVSELKNVELFCTGPSKKSRNKAIKVDFDKAGGVTVNVSIKIDYTQSVSDIAFKIQETIRHNVESMTEYHVVSVNVHVSGVNFEDKTAVVAEAEENTANQG